MAILCEDENQFSTLVIISTQRTNQTLLILSLSILLKTRESRGMTIVNMLLIKFSDSIKGLSFAF